MYEGRSPRRPSPRARSGPSRASRMRRGAFPGRNPGIRVSRAIFRKAASMALSNSASSTSTDTFTLLPSKGSTLERIGGSPYRGPPLTLWCVLGLVDGLEEDGDALPADAEQLADALHRKAVGIQHAGLRPAKLGVGPTERFGAVGQHRCESAGAVPKEDLVPRAAFVAQRRHQLSLSEHSFGATRQLAQRGRHGVQRVEHAVSGGLVESCSHGSLRRLRELAVASRN